MKDALYLNSAHFNEIKNSHVIYWQDAVAYTSTLNEIVAIPLKFRNELLNGIQIERYLIVDTSDWTGRIVEYNAKDMVSLSAKTRALTKINPSSLVDFSGQVRIFSMTYILAVLNKYEGSKLVKNYIVSPKGVMSSNPNGRGRSCVDWYLETYFGGELMSSEYLFTTCSDGSCQQERQSIQREAPLLNACGGGGSGGSNPPVYTASNSPGKKYGMIHDDPCQFTSEMWSSSVSTNLEWQGVITQDYSLVIIGSTGATGGSFDGLYQWATGLTGPDAVKTYYYYPADGNMPPFAGTVLRTINNIDYYFIPILATVHTHTPCLADGSDGASHEVGSDDRNLANRFSSINHYIIGCNEESGPITTTTGNVVAQFNGSSTNFFNKSNCSVPNTFH